MRILLVSPGGDRFGGGMGTVTKNIKDYLETTDDISVRVLDSRGEAGFLLSFFFLFRSLISFIGELIFSKEKLVLHINVSERASFYRKFCFISLAKLAKVPCVLHHHGAELIPFCEGCSSFTKRVVEYCMNNADINIVLGRKWKLFIERNFKQCAPVQVIFNAVPQHHYNQVTNEKYTISMIANLSERKGVSLALDAAAQLNKKSEFVFNFIGGGEVDRYRTMAKSMGLNDSCVFHGWISRSQTLDLMANSDVLVLPSYDEGLPMVILEAMAHGVPVVCTPVGSIGEVFTDNKECLFMEVGSSQSLFENIHKLQQSSELRDRIVASASATYKQNFSIDKFMTSLITAYKSIV
jgi:glycosyltransferase involved in cell wall biosynthesis